MTINFSPVAGFRQAPSSNGQWDINKDLHHFDKRFENQKVIVQSHLQIILTVLNLHCHVACGPINGKQARKQISIETINPNKFAIESFMDDQSVKPSIATLWRNVALRTFNPAAAPRCLPSHVIAKPGMLITHPVSSCFEQIQWADRFKHTSSIIIYLPWIF